MATKLEKMHKQMNDNFYDELPTTVREKFNIEIETHFHFCNLSLVSTRIDGEEFTPEQKLFIQGFELGYLSAMNQVESASTTK